MKQRKSIKVSKEKAIIIASNHNNIPILKGKGLYRFRIKGSIKASQPKTRILIPNQPQPKKKSQISIQSLIYTSIYKGLYKYIYL